MEAESFEDEAVAEVLNKSFISIKVDREERPDVDSVCMHACQIMTGSGGWPLSIFMTPERKPFYAGTYFPKRSAYGRVGFIELLEKIAELWLSEREGLLQSCEDILTAIQRHQNPTSDAMTEGLINRAFEELSATFDPQYGGFGRAPKFPTPHILMFLIDYNFFSSNDKSLNMVDNTLINMYRGGIFDHIGGGFCRYSTDRKWLVPHFEKMLYDNALLAIAYTRAYAVTKKPIYKKIVFETLDYVLREMHYGEGGFYAAQDADSEAGEGAYYLFTHDEVVNVLGNGFGERVCAYLDIRPGGNFEGKSIPNRMHSVDESWDDSLKQALEKLYQYRLNRMKLRTDRKILTAWNALMIIALAEASAVFDRREYLEAALDALNFIQKFLIDAEGNLFVRWIDGEAAHKGCLDDYAFLCWAFVTLYDITLNGEYISRALSLCEKLVGKFSAGPKNGYWLSEADNDLAIRPKENGDNAMPSGNSVTGYVLQRLAMLSGDSDLQRLADEQLDYIAGACGNFPSGHCFGMMGGMLSVYPTEELVCATDRQEDADAFVRFVNHLYRPNLTAVLNFLSSPGNTPVEWGKNCVMQDGITTYYLCHDMACGLPTHNLAELFNPA